jgi:hypothetical protein
MTLNENTTEVVTTEIDNLKKELEIKKLRKEIEQIDSINNDLTKKWYKKPQWIMALSPIIVGIMTLSVAWASGFLQAQSNLNKIQEETFNRKKDSINVVIKILSAKSDSLYLSAQNLKIELKVLGRQNNELVGFRNNLLNNLKSKNEKMNFIMQQYLKSKKEKLKLEIKLTQILNNELIKKNNDAKLQIQQRLDSSLIEFENMIKLIGKDNSED